MTDATLLRAYADHGSQAAFAELVDRHGGMVHATARRLAAGDADDVAQAVFLLLARRAADLRRHENLAGWLHETALLCAANVRRAQDRHAAHVLAAAEAPVSHPAPADADLLAGLDDGLARLSDPYRQVLLLRYFEELTVEQTADRLGLTAAAVMKRSTRGLAKLRDCFARRGLTVTAQALTGCMATQVVPLSGPARAALAGTGSGTAGVPARALAAAARRSLVIGRAIRAAVGTAAVVGLAAAAIAIVLEARPGPIAAAPPATPISQAAPPPPPPAPIVSNAAVAPREVADGFLAALRDRDADRVAGYLPPGDDAQRRATARQYIAAFPDGTYARYPQRLAVQNWMVTNDAAGHAVAGTFDALSPIEAELAHLALRVEPAEGHWYVASADYTDAEARFAAPAPTDGPPGRGPVDYAHAAQCWAAFTRATPAQDPATVRPTDVPRLMAQLDVMQTTLADLQTALRGSDLAPADGDVRHVGERLTQLQQAMQQRGADGLRQTLADWKADPDMVRDLRSLSALGPTLNGRADAWQDAHHADARPTCVERDRQFTDEAGRTVTIPGPLMFPAWLRATAAYKTWQTQHDVRTFTTGDDAGHLYTVSAMGWVKRADGTPREVIGQVRMYRPDRTLAAVTDWEFGQDGISDWSTLDPTGSRLVWKVEQRHHGNHDPLALGRIVHFAADGSEHCYEFTGDGVVRFESTMDPVGENMRSVRDPHPDAP